MKLNDDAIAYTWLSIIVLFIACAFIWVIFTQPINAVVDSANDNIADSKVSEQTAGAFNFSLNLFIGIPIIVLFVLLLYGVVTALYSRREEVY
jgi:hypothetical protein